MPLKSLSKRKRPHAVRKKFILPCCLLAVNIFEEVMFYKTQLLDNPYLRTLLIIAIFVAGISFGAFVMTPFIDRLLSGVYKASKKRAGLFGELLFLSAAAVVFFFLYYMVYIHGPESLLPDAWRNHGFVAP